jgi:MinD-like ATPase involved in chromosome partitioning or flagellar assembly
MTPDEYDEYDAPETSVSRETTELHPFAPGYPDRTGPGIAVPDVPVMEPLPDGAALPDPGYPVMPAVLPSSAVQPPATSAQAYASGRVNLPPAPPRDEPATEQLVMEQLVSDQSGQGDEPDTYPWPRSQRPATVAPTWRAAPYVEPRAPEEAPPLRGPAVPWSEVRAGSERPEPSASEEPAASPEPPASPEPATIPEPLASAVPASEPEPEPEPEPDDLSAPAVHPTWPLAAPLPAYDFLEAEAADAEPDEHGLTDAAAAAAGDLDAARETADTLTSDLLLSGRRASPDIGWRRTVYRATGGLIRIEESAATMRRRELVGRIRTPVTDGHHRVAVLSLKGGVGKTTATVGLGSTLASLRGDRVIAVDGNPDRGTLSDKVRLQTPATIRDLLNERAFVSRYSDVRGFTSQAPSRLEILASDRDPAVSVAFSADDYRTVAAVLERFYSVCITDCGTGLLHSAMAGILELADQIVLVSSPSVDGARSASATLDWLEAHGYGDLVRGAVVVLSAIRRKSKSTVDVDRLEQHFAARSRAVVRVPFDAHLEEGAEVELELLSTETADAYLELAALVADGFSHPARSIAGVTPRFPLA